MSQFKATLCLVLFLVNSACATTYCLRADGTAESMLAAHGPVEDPGSCVSPDTLDTTLLKAGDKLIISGLGGPFTNPRYQSGNYALLHLDNINGESSKPIHVMGDPNNLPQLDISQSAIFSSAISIKNSDDIILESLLIKGNGSKAAVHVSKNSGASGYGIILRKIDVLSNWGRANINHDCFSVDDTSEVYFNQITARGCRPESTPYEGSHQGITAHDNAKIKVVDSVISDSNHGIVITGNSIAHIQETTFSDIYVSNFDIGLNGTASSTLAIRESTILNNAGSSVLTNSSQHGKIELVDSEILVTDTKPNVIRSGPIVWKNNHVEINTTAWRPQTLASNIHLEGNEFIITRSSPYFMEIVSGPSLISIIKNSIKIKSSTDNLLSFIRDKSGNSEVVLFLNEITNENSSSSLISYRPGGSKLVILNNTMVASSLTDFNSIENIIANNDPTYFLIVNNIISSFDFTIDDDKTDLISNNNIFNVVGGLQETDNIIADPNFVNISEGDLTLKATSPAIDNASPSLFYEFVVDYSINIETYGPPDIGAHEYQPGSPLQELLLGEGDKIRVYPDGLSRFLEAPANGNLSSTSLDFISARIEDDGYFDIRFLRPDSIKIVNTTGLEGTVSLLKNNPGMNAYLEVNNKYYLSPVNQPIIGNIDISNTKEQELDITYDESEFWFTYTASGLPTHVLITRNHGKSDSPICALIVENNSGSTHRLADLLINQQVKTQIIINDTYQSPADFKDVFPYIHPNNDFLELFSTNELNEGCRDTIRINTGELHGNLSRHDDLKPTINLFSNSIESSSNSLSFKYGDEDIIPEYFSGNDSVFLACKTIDECTLKSELISRLALSWLNCISGDNSQCDNASDRGVDKNTRDDPTSEENSGGCIGSLMLLGLFMVSLRSSANCLSLKKP